MRAPRNLVVGAATFLAFGLVVGAGIQGALAAFNGTTSNSGNNFSAAADFVACTASTTVVAKTVGYIPGYIKQGGSYYIYANVSDTGNPASGISTVTADVSTIDSASATAVALVSGAYSVGGVSYNYRSASRTVKSPLTAGSYSYSITCTDNASNTGTQSGFTVTVDNTAPSGTDIQTANGGATVGKAELNDTVTFTFSEQMEPNSILAGWTGASTNVVVRINNAGGGDTLEVWDSGNSSVLPFGTVNLGRTDYVTANRTFGASGTPSTMVQSGSTITVTLGTASGSTGTAAANGTMTWPPSATATDRAGNACSTTSVTEGGAADKEF